jgi:hypothetical protein
MFAPSSILATEFRAAAPVTSGSHYFPVSVFSTVVVT